MSNTRIIGILTFHKTVNYGAILQCLALQKILSEKGWSPYVIDYRHGLPPLKLKSFPRRFIGKIVRLLNGPLGASERKKKTERFAEREFLGVSKRYYNLDELRLNPPPGDAYVVGSDQVWNPEITNFDDTFFLKFGSKTTKRISYAASLGLDSFRPDQIAWLLDGLESIDHISVREDSAKQMISGSFERPVKQVLDPTLLLTRDDWLLQAGGRSGKPYVFVYLLPGDRDVERSVKQLAEDIAKRNDLQIKIVGDRELKRLIPGGKRAFGVGPEEFLNLICNASFIITNSFHGTAFATNMRIPFISVVPEQLDTNNLRSGRIVNLVRDLDLEHRVVQCTDVDQILNGVISLWSKDDLFEAQRVLGNLRSESINWLERALSA